MPVNPSEPSDGNAPAYDVILWLHAGIMSTAFILFAFGSVVGMTKKRGLHIALQAIGLGLVPLGLVLPSFHKSLHLPQHIPHRYLGWAIVILLAGQAALGLMRQSRWTKRAHSILGPAFLVLFPAQIELGVISITQTCYQRGYHTGQCVAHFVMGSAFIYYGFFISMRWFGLLKWLQRPDSFYDSIIILTWGFVNSLTEHPWGQNWNHGDIQHTSMGVLWLTSGGLSMLISLHPSLSRINDFNFVPSVVFGVTGVAMSLHHQMRPISTTMHAFFGLALLLASMSKAVGLFLRTRRLDLFTAFWMVTAGMLFMGSNEEALAYLEDKAMFDASSWMMLMLSASFLIYAFGLLLISMYVNGTNGANDTNATLPNVEDLGTPLTAREDTLRDESGYICISSQDDDSSLVK